MTEPPREYKRLPLFDLGDVVSVQHDGRQVEGEVAGISLFSEARIARLKRRNPNYKAPKPGIWYLIMLDNKDIWSHEYTVLQAGWYFPGDPSWEKLEQCCDVELDRHD